VFTTAATATVIGLMSDVAPHARATDRARLAAVLGGLLAGAAAGGLLLTHFHTLAAVLPMALTLLVIAGAATGELAPSRTSTEPSTAPGQV
jgi:predicted lipid-binding transport protein (Tim44 family)